MQHLHFTGISMPICLALLAGCAASMDTTSRSMAATHIRAPEKFPTPMNDTSHRVPAASPTILQDIRSNDAHHYPITLSHSEQQRGQVYSGNPKVAFGESVWFSPNELQIQAPSEVGNNIWQQSSRSPRVITPQTTPTAPKAASNRWASPLTGALLGGYVGNQFGRGAGKVASTLLGTSLGATLANENTAPCSFELFASSLMGTLYGAALGSALSQRDSGTVAVSAALGSAAVANIASVHDCR